MARDTRPSDGHFSDIRKRRHQTRQRQLRRAWLQIMICGASLTASQSTLAEVPTGANVVAGAATFTPGANSLDITATTSRSIVDWNSFNIGAGNTVNFNLPDASSAILNRVTTPNMPSAIHGMLQSNGNVYLVNPSGIVVGSTGTINTNAFVASTLDITNQNFLSGGALQFNESGNAASIINHGTINTGEGGAHLIAGSVTNHGSITSTGGNITLSGGGTVTLNNGVTYVQPRLDVLTSGISPTAGLIQNTGSIRATGAATSGGEVYLVNPSGTILHDGTIATQRIAAGPSTEQNATIGGHVQLEAGHITLASNSIIDASGTDGGGRVLVGGDWQGSGPMHQATRVTMEAGATIDASAIDRGDGGRIVLWSDIWNNESVTEVFGTLLSTGGSLAGNGGEIETSGHLLRIGSEAQASTRAASGQTGRWLLDPIDFTITAGNAPQTTSGIGAGTLVAALLNNNVTIQTDSATAGLGDLLVNADVLSSSDTSLTLHAHNDLRLAANIRTGGGIVLKANNDIVATNSLSLATMGGDILVSSNADEAGYGSFTALADISIHTGGGNLTIGGGVSGLGFAQGGETGQTYQHGIRLAGAVELRSAGGDIKLLGRSGTTSTPSGMAWGIGFENDVFMDSGAGSIFLHGIGKNTTQGVYSHGITFGGSVNHNSATVHLTSASNQPTAIHIMGDASTSTVSGTDHAKGIVAWSNNTSVTATGAGGIQMLGSALSEQNEALTIHGGELLASAGPIELKSTLGRINLGHNVLYMGAKPNSSATSSSSDIQIKSDRVSIGTNLLLHTSGIVTVAPTSTSFSDPLVWQTSTANPARSIGGLSLGKAGNTSRIDVTAAQTVDGNINIHAGQIKILSDLIAHGDINIIGDTEAQIDFNGIGVEITTCIRTSDESNGNIMITGRGGNHIEGNQFGVHISGGVEISAGGNGNLTVLGTGGAAHGGRNHGIRVGGTSSTTLARLLANGDVNLVGHGGGIGKATGDNDGVSLINSAIGSSVGGEVNITGIVGNHGQNYIGWASEGIVLSSSGYFSLLAGRGKNITITADKLSLGHNARIGNNFDDAGILFIQPLSQSFANTINFSYSTSQLRGLGGLVIGKPGNNADINIFNSFALNGDISLFSQNIFINGTVSTPPRNQVKLFSIHSVHGGGTGRVITGALELAGGGSVALVNNNRVHEIAFAGGTLLFSNEQALRVGSAGETHGVSATGTISIATTDGNLTVAGDIATSSQSATAIVLNAGSIFSSGNTLGGDIIVEGMPSITAGSGGRVTLYSGSIENSFGVRDLIGHASGRFRYNSTATSANFSLGLDDGLYGIFREQPTVKINKGETSFIYGAPVVFDSIAHGVNGDTADQIFAELPELLVNGSISTSGKLSVGTHTVVVSGGIGQLGYAIEGHIPGTLTVTPREITPTNLIPATKVYDGTTGAIVNASGVSLVGLLPNDIVELFPYRWSFSDKHAGQNKAIYLDSYILSGVDAGNYTLAQPTNLTAAITPFAITLSGVTAAKKIYDGSTVAEPVATNANFAGMIDGDSLSVSSIGVFQDKHVGTGKIVSLTNTFGGADVGNYAITDQTSTTADITARPITLSGISAGDKVYDGTTVATIDTSGVDFTGMIAGDDLTVASQGTFADKNVGTAKQVLLNNLFGGADVGNYLITDQTSTTADITPKPITISGITASDKIYDGTTTAIVDTSNVDLSGLVAGDDLMVFSQGVFADRNVGSNKQVLLNNIFSGTDLANYLITDQSVAYANVDPKELAVSGLLALSKVYDATTTATIDYSSALLSGLISGDDVSIASVTGSFADKNAGAGKSVATNTLLSGVNATNYVITNQPATTASITPAPLTLAGIEAASKVYDGNASATIVGAPSISPIFGDSVSINGTATATFDTKNVGTGKSIFVVGFTLSGADAGNYALQLPTNMTASITPAPLMITARNDSKLVTLQDSVGYAGIDYAGLVAGEDESVLNGTLLITRTIAGENAGQYMQSLLPSGVTAENYEIQFAAGDFTIRPADALRVRFADSSSIYGDSQIFTPLIAEYIADGQAFHTLDSYRLSGNHFAFVDSVGEQTELSIVPLSPVYASSGNLRVGEYVLGAPAPSTPSGNFANQLIVTGTHSVTAAPITVIASGLSKVYDGNTSIPEVTLAMEGLRGGDNVSVIGSGQFLSRHAGNGLGYRLTDLSLLGSDADNYVLATGSTLLGTGGVITPKAVTLMAPTIERFFDGGIVAVPTRDQLEALTAELGVVGDTVQSIQLRFDTPDVGIGKKLTPSMAIIADGNGGWNYALSYAPSFRSRILELPRGAAGGFDAKLETTNRQSVTDTNTRYTASSPVGHAPVDFIKPTPAVGKSIQTSGSATGPAVSVIVTGDAIQEGGETFIGSPDQEVERKKE